MLTCTKTIANNPNFKLGTLEQNRVVSSYGKLIGNASSDVETITSAAKILNNIMIIFLHW